MESVTEVRDVGIHRGLKVRNDDPHVMRSEAAGVASAHESVTGSSVQVCSKILPVKFQRRFHRHHATIVYNGSKSGSPACLPAIHRNSMTSLGSVNPLLILFGMTSRKK